MTENGELALVEKAKNGDIHAFEDLMKTTSGRIYNLGYRLLRNKEDAADIMQETYMAAYENLPRFKGNSSFSTWLCDEFRSHEDAEGKGKNDYGRPSEGNRGFSAGNGISGLVRHAG